MSWSKIQIKQHDGNLVEAQAPVIISASRSTDIPAFYSDWFINRLKAGYVKWKNPFNGVPLYVSFEKVDEEVRKAIRGTIYLFLTLFLFACNQNALLLFGQTTFENFMKITIDNNNGEIIFENLKTFFRFLRTR